MLGVATGNANSANVTDHPITLPAHQAGDLLVVCFSVDGSPTVSIDAGASTAGWSIVLDQNGSSSACRGVLLSKVADDGATTLQLTTSAAERSTHISYRTDGSAVDATGGTGGAVHNDPPSHTPGGGAQNYLWLVYAASDDNFPMTSAPTDFDELRQSSTVSGGANTSVCERELNASSLNPGTFTATNVNRAVMTIAIAP